MLYNVEKKKIKAMADCINCPYMDMRTKKCSGLNKCCFEYDERTGTVIDGITKMALKIEKEQ